GEHQAAVDDDAVAARLDHHAVHSHFAEAAERDDADGDGRRHASVVLRRKEGIKLLGAPRLAGKGNGKVRGKGSGRGPGPRSGTGADSASLHATLALAVALALARERRMPRGPLRVTYSRLGPAGQSIEPSAAGGSPPRRGSLAHPRRRRLGEDPGAHPPHRPPPARRP